MYFRAHCFWLCDSDTVALLTDILWSNAGRSTFSLVSGIKKNLFVYALSLLHCAQMFVCVCVPDIPMWQHSHLLRFFLCSVYIFLDDFFTFSHLFTCDFLNSPFGQHSFWHRIWHRILIRIKSLHVSFIHYANTILCALAFVIWLHLLHSFRTLERFAQSMTLYQFESVSFALFLLPDSVHSISSTRFDFQSFSIRIAIASQFWWIAVVLVDWLWWPDGFTFFRADLPWNHAIF